MGDNGTSFKPSRLKPTRFALLLIALLLIVPLFGPWYFDLPVLALFAALSYWDLKRIRKGGVPTTDLGRKG